MIHRLDYTCAQTVMLGMIEFYGSDFYVSHRAKKHYSLSFAGLDVKRP